MLHFLKNSATNVTTGSTMKNDSVACPNCNCTHQFRGNRNVAFSGLCWVSGNIEKRPRRCAGYAWPIKLKNEGSGPNRTPYCSPVFPHTTDLSSVTKVYNWKAGQENVKKKWNWPPRVDNIGHKQTRALTFPVVKFVRLQRTGSYNIAKWCRSTIFSELTRWFSEKKGMKCWEVCSVKIIATDDDRQKDLQLWMSLLSLKRSAFCWKRVNVDFNLIVS